MSFPFRVRSKSLGITVIGTCSVLVGAALAIPKYSASNPKVEATLHVRESDLNFGTFYRTPLIERTLHIKNTGQQMISITGFRKSCSCTSVTPSAVTLAPGAQRVLQLTVRPPSSEFPREFAARLQPISPQWSLGAVTWQIRGQLEDVVDVRPSLLLVSGYVGSLPSTIAFEIGIVNTIVDGVECECPPELGEVAVKVVNASCWMGVFKPNSDLDLNMHRSAIRIHALSHGSVVSTFALPVVVNVAPVVTATPSTVVLGTIPLEGTRSKTITVSTADGAPTILDLRYPSDVGLHAEITGRSGERFVAIRVQQQARSLGFQKHLITVAAMHLDEVTRVELPVIYHGILAQPGLE